MLTEERRRLILDRLRGEGRVIAAALSEELGISEATVRRDLRELSDEGLLRRVHGGALPASPTATLDVLSRGRASADEKRALAAAAVRLVPDGAVILLDGGSTNLLLAEALPQGLRGTVLTPSPAVALALLGHERLEVVLAGGRLLRRAGTAAGPVAVDAIRGLHADLCVLGLCSVDADAGITCTELDEVHVKRAMVASAARVLALATADKLGTAAPHVVAPAAELDELVTSEAAPAAAVRRLTRAGVEVARAPWRGAPEGGAVAAGVQP